MVNYQLNTKHRKNIQSLQTIFLISNLKEKKIQDLKLRLKSHIKSLQVFLYDNCQYLTQIDDLKRFVQHEESKRSSIIVVVDSSFDQFKDVDQLEQELKILESEKACFEFMLNGIDENQGASQQDSLDPSRVSIGPFIRERAKRIKEALNGLIQEL